MACDAWGIDDIINDHHGHIWLQLLNTLSPRQNGPHFTDNFDKCVSLNENVWISIKISLKFVPKGPINNIPALVQIMAWHRPGDKPLSEPMVISSPRHIYASLGLNELMPDIPSEHQGISNHRQMNSLFNGLFSPKSKKHEGFFFLGGGGGGGIHLWHRFHSPRALVMLNSFWERSRSIFALNFLPNLKIENAQVVEALPHRKQQFGYLT